MKATTEDILVSVKRWLKIRHIEARPESTLQELGLDSLDVVEITIAVEEDLHIIVNDEEVEFKEGATFQDLLEAIATHSV